jgi:hypothetical protein
MIMIMLIRTHDDDHVRDAVPVRTTDGDATQFLYLVYALGGGKCAMTLAGLAHEIPRRAQFVRWG